MEWRMLPNKSRPNDRDKQGEVVVWPVPNMDGTFKNETPILFLIVCRERFLSAGVLVVMQRGMRLHQFQIQKEII